MVMVDSDILIWILRGEPDIKEKFTVLVGNPDLIICISAIQIAEIYAGLREKEKIDTELFLKCFQVLPLEEQNGQLAGKYLNKYNKSHDISLADALIAAIVKEKGITLWTMNKKHYPMLNENDFFKLI